MCVCVCVLAGLLQKYGPILLKLDVLIGPGSGNNGLTFSGDPVSVTDPRSFFRLP